MEEARSRIVSRRRSLAALAGLPLIAAGVPGAAMVREGERVEQGGLLMYRLYHEDESRRTASLVDKLLRGANPALIPFELPTKSYFVINRRTAAAIGVKFPPDFLLRADEVIG